MVHLTITCRERRHRIIFSLRGQPRSTTFIDDLQRAGAIIDITPEDMDGLSSLKHIKDLIKKNRIDVIHSHFSPLCHYVNFTGWLLGVKGRFWTKHSMSEIDTYTFFKRRFVVVKQKISSLLASNIIMVSDAIKEDYVGLGVKPEKILTIPLGIDIERYSKNEEARGRLRGEFGIDDKTVLIGTVSRAEPVKGLRYLVEAMPQVIRRVPGVMVLVVGGGSQLDDLKKTAIELGIHDHVIFEGIREDIPEILSAIDIFVLPSISEGMPLALLEAMASGKPVIGSKVGGIPELIEDGLTGYLVPPGDPNRLAGSIVKLSVDHELMRSMGREARRKVEEKYNVKVQVERLVNLYEKQLNND